ncbi:hypothetical protein T265_06296 [Opisthorchis viverrini]|uniref:Mediator of RNA polymerase II transcription subunit 23 n=1 Tax=Opisthorchis viverrini TaxID=6198 RepID=A0A075AE12_OPIVI|nr:hypothetical protein T265_06296 [Opisthorchis viverrini]KER26439.1 hypothetical protein T265_06296 [Opisthorchis viverrini]
MRILWGLDLLIEKQVFHPREVAHSLVCSDQLRVESAAFFRCAFKLLLKLIFFLDYKVGYRRFPTTQFFQSNREVFNKSIEKSSQFIDSPVDDRFNLRFIDPAVELIQLLLSREMCLMPAYFAMHELIRSFPVELSGSPHKAIQDSVTSFMDSFARPARLLYSQIHQSIKPICGITPPTTPGFRLDSTNLLLTVVKGAMRYPDFLTSSQTQLLCFVLGQLRCTELVAGMLDPSTGKSKTRSIGLEKAIVDWIIELMEITESTDDRTWVRTTFEHLISVVITFMLSSTIRFSEIVVKLNTKLEGRKWTKSSHYVMWFVLNVTSGFIGKNMLALFSSDTVVLQTILNNLNNSALRFDLCFTPAKCKALLLDWVGSNLNIMLADEVLEGRKWTKSSHYVMWFVLNVTSGFIGKNMLALFSSDTVVLQTILNNLNNSALRFDLCFTPAKCKALLLDWVGSNLNIMLADEVVNNLAKDGIFIWIWKATPAFVILHCGWRRCDTRLSVNGPVYNTTVCSTLIRITWPLSRKMVFSSGFGRPHQLFLQYHSVLHTYTNKKRGRCGPRISKDFRCLTIDVIARVWWEHRISNAEVRRMAFGRNNSSTIYELITPLAWLRAAYASRPTSSKGSFYAIT